MVAKVVSQLGVRGSITDGFSYRAGDSHQSELGRLHPNKDRSVTLERPSKLGFQAFRFGQRLLDDAKTYTGGILLEAAHPVELPTTDSWRTPPWQARRPEDTMSLARAMIVGSKGIALRDSDYNAHFYAGNALHADAAVTPIRFTDDEAQATGCIILVDMPGTGLAKRVCFLSNLDPGAIGLSEKLGPGRVQRFYYASTLGDVSKQPLSTEEMDALLNGVVIYDNE